MNVLLTVEDLAVGGAQVFVLRLAQALRQAGHTVCVFCHYAHLTDGALLRQLAPGVDIRTFGSRWSRLDYAGRKAEGLGRRLGWKSAVRERLVIRALRRLLTEIKPDIVNSHTIKADYVAARALADIDRQSAPGAAPPLVVTMHGCYELFARNDQAAEVTPKGWFALRHAAAFVYLTAKNLEVFDHPGAPPLARLPHYQIYNGFRGELTVGSARTRASLGIQPRDMVFGMVARGIPEKGWEFALTSFLSLADAHPTAHLVLVGHSQYLTDLQARYPHPRVHFTGHSPNPIDWITLFDVGLLPSYFHAESLPNSIAEYLFCGKPVIASRIGEVPQMLLCEQGLAGILVDQANWQLTEPAQLTAAMHTYLTQPAELARHRALAPLAFRKFDMDTCVAAYQDLYEQGRRARGVASAI